ncbi:MAG: enoyl-CoA hydratase-related protein [bacterium]
MSEAKISYVVENAVATVTVDHPPVNALNRVLWMRVGEVFEELGERSDVRAAIVTGAGEKAFVAGADITELGAHKRFTGEAFSRICQESMNKVEFCPFPVIAAVNGFALGGGCELVMACDIRLASTKARFGLPEINLGILPGAGGTQRIARIVPKGYAKLLAMTGDMISAEEALRIGLVDRLVEPESLLAEAKALAEKLAAKAPMALRMVKKSINEGIAVSLREGLDIEARCFGVLCGTEDKNEGVAAFLGKRKPEFKGK